MKHQIGDLGLTGQFLTVLAHLCICDQLLRGLGWMASAGTPHLCSTKSLIHIKQIIPAHMATYFPAQ